MKWRAKINSNLVLVYGKTRTVYCYYEMLNKEAFRYRQLGSLQASVNYSCCMYVRSMEDAWLRSCLAFIASFRCCGDSRWPSDLSTDIFYKAIPHYVSFLAISLRHGPRGTVGFQVVTRQSENINLPLRDKWVVQIQVFPHQCYASLRFSLWNQPEFIKQWSGHKPGSLGVYPHLFFLQPAAEARCSSPYTSKKAMPHAAR